MNKRVEQLFSFFEETLILLMMALLVILTFVNTSLRYTVGISIPSFTELAGLLFAWIIFIGSSLAIKYKSHIRIDIIDHFLSPKLFKYYSLTINLILAIVFLYLIYYGSLLTIGAIDQKIGSWQLSRSLLYAAFPVGFAFMFIRLIESTIKDLKKKDVASEKEVNPL